MATSQEMQQLFDRVLVFRRKRFCFAGDCESCRKKSMWSLETNRRLCDDCLVREVDGLVERICEMGGEKLFNERYGR